MKKIFTSLLVVLFSAFSFAQGYWNKTSMQGKAIRENSNVTSYYTLDINQLRSKLAGAVLQTKSAKPVEIVIPTLEGKMERFAVYSLPVVVQSLADKYHLGSYVGVGIDDPLKTVRFSTAPNDFQSMIMKSGAYEFIEPQNAEKTVYGVHPKVGKTGKYGFTCSTKETELEKAQIEKLFEEGSAYANNGLNFGKASDKKYRTMRLALSVTGEYTTYFGGVAGALAQMNATMTRVNGVLEKDMALHLILQDFPALIYTNASTDPYSNASTGAGGAWNTELQNNLTNTIGNAAYDIGHLFGASGGGGNAGCIGCVCVDDTTSTSDTNKGSGFTSPADGIPMGDNFDIDYVVHEMGHQLGSNHSFSMSLEGTGMNVEPGSGTTIMGYAGITGATDVQPHSDPYFHAVNIIQMQTNLGLASKTCDIETAVANNPPVIAALTGYTIPKSTAFVLTASATDAEGDPITYSWEQVNSATTASTITNLGTLTNGPDFRVWNPTTSGTRYFPKLSTVLSGSLKSTTDWEAVSTVARSTLFRVLVRDNNPDATQQQTQSATQLITVGSAGPFKVTSTKVYNDVPASAVTWDVVTTNAAPYNVANVMIDYTKDNGATWTVLSASTPNDGSEGVSFAGVPTNTVIKIRVSALGNVFYAVGTATVSAAPLAAPNCATQTAPANNATAVAFASVNLTWTAPTTGDVVETYDVYLDQNADPTTLVTNTASTSYTATGLLPSTKYYWKVIAKNAVGAATGCTVFSFTTADPSYCTAGATSTSYEKISNVTFADINKSSTSTAGYEDFTSVVGNVIKGNTYTFTATFTGTSYTSDQVIVWVDLNGDKDFDDAGEQVLITATSKSPWTGSITIPTTATASTTRMRVRMHDSSLGPNATPCGTSTYGQVEDYTLVLGTLATSDVSKSQVQVYPNPADDILNVSKVSAKAKYTIYSVDGKVVSKGNLADNKVNVSKLTKGVYLITVDDNGQVTQSKFIKK